MSGMPFGGGCCPSGDGEVTYLKIGARGIVIGMAGLEKVFQQLYSLDRHPDEATDAELVEMARKFNYIPNRAAIEADYAAALREAYIRFYGRQLVRRN